jgi:hypothetical protein
MTPNRLSWRKPWPASLLMAALLPFAVPVELASPDPASQQDIDKLTLADISWLSGHWRSESSDSMTEELWMPARGRIMLGLNRNVSGEAHGQFEYLRIVQTKVDTYYWASPGGSEPTPFKMTKATDDHVVFENPEHDFPKRIEYRRKGEELTAQIFGDEPGPSWTLKRIGDVK